MYLEKTINRQIKSLWKTVGLFAVAALIGTLTANLLGDSNGLVFAEEQTFCSETAKMAYRACRHEVADDYWIAVGSCYNLSERDDRVECLQEAFGELEEARQTCLEQNEARLEVCNELDGDPYDPQIDPADFVDPTTATPNQYWPLVPGTVWVYEGGDETITVTVTDEIKEILGVTCVVVNDVVEEDGEVIEDTDDWYAQDKEGNVWYFGEIAKNYEDGELVDLEGSWKAGVDGAKPGIIMSADPQLDRLYRQEFLLGEAEDVGKVVSLGEDTVTVPNGTFMEDVLKTEDYTPIEPDVIEFKYYAPGVGLVLEVDPETEERVELISMSMP